MDYFWKTPDMCVKFGQVWRALHCQGLLRFLFVCWFLYWAGFPTTSFGQAGTLDLSFATTTWPGNAVFNAIAVQGDGKIVVASTVPATNGGSPIVRFNSDGSPDSTFTAGTFAFGEVFCLASQKDGKILVGGSFQYFGGTTNSYLVRLNQDGSLDQTFQYRPSSVSGQPVSALAIQSDGRILYGGRIPFGSRATGVAVDRLKGDGRQDRTFQGLYVPAPEGAIGGGHTTEQIQVLENDEILVAGGSAFLKVHSNGALDRRYTRPTTGLSFSVNCMAVQKNGQIYIGGRFTNINNTVVNNLVRFHPDGALDTNFVPAIKFVTAGLLYQLHVTPDNKLLVSGSIFATADTNRASLLRLNMDGSLDTSFEVAGARVGGGFGVQEDGKILIRGYFTNQMGASWVQTVRLLSDSASAPVIVEAPASQTSFAGDMVRMHVTVACGEATPGFTWERNGSPLLEHNSAVLVISNCAPPDAGAYRVVISNALGVVTSAVATLTVKVPTVAGLADPSFYAGPGPNGTVAALACDTNGSVIIGGAFTKVDGIPMGRIARLNSSGALDPTFNPGLGADWEIHAVGVQNDGKILVAGAFSNFNGTATGPVVRLNADGTVDTSFSVTGITAGVAYAFAITPDLKILLGGNFGLPGLNVRKVVRLNSNGSLDGGFNCNLPGQSLLGENVYSLNVLADSTILAGGSFQGWLARLRTNGQVQAYINQPTSPGIRAIAGDNHGQFYAAIFRTNAPGIGFVDTVARFSSNGILSAEFKSVLKGPSGSLPEIRALAVDDCSRLLVGGNFTVVNGSNQLCLARLDNVGNIDYAFSQNLRVDGKVLSILPQPDGTTLIAGDFVHVGGAYRPRIARLLPDPPTPPLLLKELASQTVVGGTPVTFDPGAGYCEENTFQWFKNGSPVMGETNSTLSLASPRTTDAADFFLVAGNRYGMVTSRVSSLTVTKESILPGSLNIDFYPQIPNRSWYVPILSLESGEKVMALLEMPSVGSNMIVKLNADGSRDSSFKTRTNTASVYTLAAQTNGTVWVGQSAYPSLIRLLPNGDRDTNFVTPVSGSVIGLLEQPDGKVLVRGNFSLPTKTITRLLPSGAHDTNFLVSPMTNVNYFALQKDGKILIAGVFTNVGKVARRNVARLNRDGTLDPSFQMPLGTNVVRIDSLAVGGNDEILVAGFFSISNETRRSQLVRLQTNGQVDPTFDSQPGSNVIRRIAVSSNGKVIVAGTLLSFRGTPVRWITRLNRDGSVDPTFNIGTLSGTNIYDLKMHADGRIFVGGDFTSINGLPRPSFAVLNGEPTLWNASATESGFEFSIPTFSGWNAIVETKEGLDGTDWVPLPVAPVNQRVIDDRPSTGERFYRVRYE